MRESLMKEAHEGLVQFARIRKYQQKQHLKIWV